jgi:flagellar basal-body rod protein FlgB
VDLFDSTELTLTAAMRGATARQQALSDNLANVDTPGYVRKDVDFQDTLKAALAGGTSTGSGAASATAAASSLDGMSFTAQPDSSSTAMRVDGNSVDVDKESSALAENALEYQSLEQVARTRIEILQSAMGAGN